MKDSPKAMGRIVLRWLLVIRIIQVLVAITVIVGCIYLLAAQLPYSGASSSFLVFWAFVLLQTSGCIYRLHVKRGTEAWWIITVVTDACLCCGNWVTTFYLMEWATPYNCSRWSDARPDNSYMICGLQVTFFYLTAMDLLATIAISALSTVYLFKAFYTKKTEVDRLLAEQATLLQATSKELEDGVLLPTPSIAPLLRLLLPSIEEEDRPAAFQRLSGAALADDHEEGQTTSAPVYDSQHQQEQYYHQQQLHHQQQIQPSVSPSRRTSHHTARHSLRRGHGPGGGGSRSAIRRIPVPHRSRSQKSIAQQRRYSYSSLEISSNAAFIVDGQRGGGGMQQQQQQQQQQQHRGGRDWSRAPSYRVRDGDDLHDGVSGNGNGGGGSGNESGGPAAATAVTGPVHSQTRPSIDFYRHDSHSHNHHPNHYHNHNHNHHRHSSIITSNRDGNDDDDSRTYISDTGTQLPAYRAPSRNGSVLSRGVSERGNGGGDDGYREHYDDEERIRRREDEISARDGNGNGNLNGNGNGNGDIPLQPLHRRRSG